MTKRQLDARIYNNFHEISWVCDIHFNEIMIQTDQSNVVIYAVFRLQIHTSKEKTDNIHTLIRLCTDEDNAEQFDKTDAVLRQVDCDHWLTKQELYLLWTSQQMHYQNDCILVFYVHKSNRFSDLHWQSSSSDFDSSNREGSR